MPLPHLNVAAEPVRFLDYLLEDAQPAAVPYGGGLLVRIPDPGRYALHKLIVAQGHRPLDAAKSRKDILQATALLECLREVRPGVVVKAKEAASAMPPRLQNQLTTGLLTLPEVLRQWLRRL